MREHILVFVYGTLRTGKHNHALIEPYAERIARGFVKGKTDRGQFPFCPRAVFSEDGTSFEGELVWCSPLSGLFGYSVLDMLDQLELPYGYRRVTVPVLCVEDEKTYDAIAYEHEHDCEHVDE